MLAGRSRAALGKLALVVLLASGTSGIVLALLPPRSETAALPTPLASRLPRNTPTPVPTAALPGPTELTARPAGTPRAVASPAPSEEARPNRQPTDQEIEAAARAKLLAQQKRIDSERLMFLAMRGQGVPKLVPPQGPGESGLKSLALRVVDPQGKPVDDVLVLGNMHGSSIRRRTKDGGKLTIEASELGLEAVEAVKLELVHARFGRQGPIQVVPERTEATIQLQAVSGGTIAGRIHTLAGVVPDSPVLTVVTRKGFATRIPASDFKSWEKDGRFAVEIVASDYRVRAQASGFCASEWVGAWVARGVTTPVDLVVERAAVLSGRVTLPPDLASGKDVRLEIEVENGADKPGGATRELFPVVVTKDSYYSIGEVRPGWHRVRATDLRHLGPWDTLHVDEGEKVEELTLHVDPPGDFGLLRGRVIDLEGGIADALVVTPGAFARTKDDGTFFMRLDEGMHYLSITADGYDRLPYEVPVRIPPPGSGLPAYVVIGLTASGVDF